MWGRTVHRTFADAYAAGLRELLDHGSAAPPVRSPWSKASNFGRDDRPATELIAHTFSLEDPRACLAHVPQLPVHVAYCFGLLAWSLDGRQDVESLAYYRQGAYELSDDHRTLSGAFGHRLFGPHRDRDQLAAIVARMLEDPGHRRTYASVLRADDNFRDSREYPCAAGVQLFLREGRLIWLTAMRAQQALTVLPYDVFLFTGLHQFAAGLLGVPCGPYIHQSGTYHFYDGERALAADVVAGVPEPASLPSLGGTPAEARSAAAELIEVECRLREAALALDHRTVDVVAAAPSRNAFVDVARAALATHAYRRLGDATTTVSSSKADPAVAGIIACPR